MKKIYASLLLALSFAGVVNNAQPQTTQISTEYLMTVYIPTERKAIDSALTIVNILPGGWVKGPRISGKIIPPGGDWLRTTPSGALRLDVRLTIETDDGAQIYMTYGGVVVSSKEAGEVLARGDVLNDKGMPYFITTPQFQTSSEKYNWMNQVQGVGKMVELKRAKNDAYVKYDIFIARSLTHSIAVAIRCHRGVKCGEFCTRSWA